ncbi:MAG: protein-glutamate O-methyltransferase CheR [Deltaproteobacteria bacterium]|nr:protein-glutamate O-methyltransferase CheR [Deltaproteobacteria bacterium]
MLAADETELDSFVEAVYSTYGHDFRGYRRASLSRRFENALAKSGLSSLGELRAVVLADPLAFSTFVDDVMVHVSELFRDPNCFRALREHVVPFLRAYPTVRIWHAGCASGEEVYSTAILLSEEGLYDRAMIYGTDVSELSIERAKKALYRASRIRTYSESHRSSGGTTSLSEYYSAAHGQIILKESIRRHTFFFQHDLISDHSLGEMQVVFCRNVLMYLEPRTRERVVAKLAGSLPLGGFLCIGAGEHLPVVECEHSFKEIVPGSRIYQARSPLRSVKYRIESDANASAESLARR